VLVQVREAGLSHLFVHAAHREGDIDRDHRRLTALDHQNGESVRQLVFDDAVRQARRAGVQQIDVEAEEHDHGREA
jgi:hypothetical protein